LVSMPEGQSFKNPELNISIGVWRLGKTTYLCTIAATPSCQSGSIAVIHSIALGRAWIDYEIQSDLVFGILQLCDASLAQDIRLLIAKTIPARLGQILTEWYCHSRFPHLVFSYSSSLRKNVCVIRAIRFVGVGRNPERRWRKRSFILWGSRWSVAVNAVVNLN
jgi:hypothetical protein